MIIVRICGGLGNQMFQYAAALALSFRQRNELKLDLSWFESNQLHQGFELARVFDVKHEEASEDDYQKVLGWRGVAWLRPRLTLGKLKWLRPKAYVCEPHFHYWPEIVHLPRDIYLVGYWQSEKYFRDVAHEVRAVLRFTSPLGRELRSLVARIQSSQSVSLHVRRGDYVSDPKIAAVHGTCELDYYRAAVSFMAARLSNPVFFIFSDDIEWVRANLLLPHPAEFVTYNQGAESYNDMRLMSLCRHHIIANSTFSWWGGWLNPRSDKIVVAPRRWFANYPGDTRDLYCPGWVVL